jgi:hypothetical protein
MGNISHALAAQFWKNRRKSAPFRVWHALCRYLGMAHHGHLKNQRRQVVTDTARFIASPLGRAALASILALSALSGLALVRPAPLHHGSAFPTVVASPAAITGELA